MNLIKQFLVAHHIEGSNHKDLIAVAQAVARIPWGEGRTIEEVLETKKVGTCTGKHLVLQTCLEHLKIEHRITVCTFHWSEQGIALPKNLQEILEEGEWEHGHNFLQVRSDKGEWIDLDITWDPPLKLYGFRTFPEDWDGQTSFISLSKIIERIDGADITMKQQWLAKLSPEMQERRRQFLKELFEWVVTLH